MRPDGFDVIFISGDNAGQISFWGINNSMDFDFAGCMFDYFFPDSLRGVTR